MKDFRTFDTREEAVETLESEGWKQGEQSPNMFVSPGKRAWIERMSSGETRVTIVAQKRRYAGEWNG